MNCPHCSADLAPRVAECPHCGFSILSIRALLGTEWVRLERLTDNLSCLSLKDQRHLEIVLDDFERAYPQCFFAVYLGNLPAVITPRDLGFWLINHGAFHTQQLAKRNDFGVALVIDCERKMVSITLGYALESLVAADELDRILKRIRSALDYQRYGPAIEKAVNLFAAILKRAGTRTISNSPPGSAWGQEFHGLGLQLLRSSHRSPKVPGKG